jgi:predicted nucleic acid-binding protein
MNAPGVLLDTGPIVALLSRDDVNHARARALFDATLPPFFCCEAVIAEACFLMRKVSPDGPSEVVSLADRGVLQVAIDAREHWPQLAALMKKYADRPISFADACLIRAAEIHDEPRIATFDGDFAVYRWNRSRKFVAL